MRDPLLLVAAHDAGGAEIISSWLQRYYYEDPGLKERVWFCLAGPAIAIFERKLGGFLSGQPGDPTKVRLVVCGSSATAQIEKDVVEWGMGHGIRTVVWLDHWKNYSQRFRRAPTELWVTDRCAAQLAADLSWSQLQDGLMERTIYEPKIVVQGNPYLDDMLALIKAQTPILRLRDARQEHVLVLTEPGREPEVHGLLVRLRNYQGDIAVCLRKHPADWSVYGLIPGLSIQQSASHLASDIAWADTVIGFDSMAMVIAERAGRRVLTTLPPSMLTIPSVGIGQVKQFYA